MIGNNQSMRRAVLGWRRPWRHQSPHVPSLSVINQNQKRRHVCRSITSGMLPAHAVLPTSSRWWILQTSIKRNVATLTNVCVLPGLRRSSLNIYMYVCGISHQVAHKWQHRKLMNLKAVHTYLEKQYFCSIKFNNFLKTWGSTSNPNGFRIVVLRYVTASLSVDAFVLDNS